MAVPNLPQMESFDVLLNEETNEVTLRTRWVSAAGVLGLGFVGGTAADVSEWGDEDHDVVSTLKSHYDAAKAAFTEAGGILGDEEVGERYGFITEEA